MDTAGVEIGPVTRVVVAPARWALARPVPGPGVTPGVIGDLVREFASTRPDPASSGPLTVARSGQLGGQLGYAVLLVHRDQAVVYCAEEEITEMAAAALSDFTSAVMAGPRGVRVIRTRHVSLPACLHPAVVTAGRPGAAAAVTMYVCANLISPAAADTLGALCTAYAGGTSHCAERPAAAMRRESTASSGPGSRR